MILAADVNSLISEASQQIINGLNWGTDAAKVVVGACAAMMIIAYFFSAAKE